MQNEMKDSGNPWTGIPLEDYEQHMSHSSVGQLGLLSALTKKYLSEYQPATCVFLGVAGGNGLEHIDKDVSKQVIGIDINRDYLDACYKRYNHRIHSLQLFEVDITSDTKQVCTAPFIWAALVLEYTGIDKALEFSTSNIMPGGHLIITIQANNNLQSVSQTGIESVKKVGSIFSAVSAGALLAKANQLGYTLVGQEANQLPNGKSFLTFDLMYQEES